MEMHPVSSSRITHLGHDPSTNTMRATFKNGATYEYQNISAEEHHAIKHAGSIGSAFGHAVQGKPYHRVGG